MWKRIRRGRGIIPAMQRKTGISGRGPAQTAAAAAAKAASKADAAAREAAMAKANFAATATAAGNPKASDGLSAWLARYEPVEREVIEAHERRIANRARRAAVLAEPPPGSGCGCAGDGERDYGSYEISGQGETKMRAEETTPELGKVRAKESVPELAVVRARAVWLEVVDGVRGSATALMERLDALTDPERVEDAAMLAGWRAKYENEITERMKSRWWRRMGRKREVG